MRFFSAVSAALPLLAVAAASPILDHRQEDRSYTGPSSSLLQQNTTDSIVQWMAEARINGMVVAITTPDGDEILSFGEADNKGTKVTDETYWGIASNSKLITALTLATIQERSITLSNGEVFTLDTPVVDVVEGFQMWDADITQSITTRDFLMHVSGLPSHNFALAPGLKPSDWLRDLPYLKTAYPLRTQWEYSNMNYVIVSAIIEHISNASFFDVVQEYLFDPLEVDATWNALEAGDSQGGRSYGWLRRGVRSGLEECVGQGVGGDFENGVCSTQEAFEFWTEGTGSELVGAGSALMRGVDMLQWAKSLVNPSPSSPITNDLLTILSEQTTEIAPGTGLLYGSGEFVAPFRGYDATYHDGGLPGQYSSFYRVTNESMAVLVACNDQTYGPAFAPGIARTVLAELLGLPYADEISTALPARTSEEISKRHMLRNTAFVGRAISPRTSGVQERQSPPRYLTSDRPAPSDLDRSTYSHPAYGTITLHPFTISNATSVEEGAFPLDLFTVELAAMHGDNLRLGGENYYAHWNRSIATHLIFTHWAGQLFNVTPVLVMNRAIEESGPQAVNGSQYVGIAYGTGPAVFVQGREGEKAGVGIFGGFLGAFGYGEPPVVVEQGVEEAADLFFTRQ